MPARGERLHGCFYPRGGWAVGWAAGHDALAIRGSAALYLAHKNDRISAALCYTRDHIAEALSVERLADAVAMSLRQFSRAFRAQTGTTPARVVERIRADLARGRLEATAESVERIAEAVGFGDAENMRKAFIRIYGQPPQSIRRAIRS